MASVQGSPVMVQQVPLRARLDVQKTQAELCADVVTLLLRVGVASSSPVLAYLCYHAWLEGPAQLAALYLLLLAALLVAAFWRGVGYSVRSSVLLAVVYALALITVFREGTVGWGKEFLIAGTALTTLLLGQRAGLLSLLAGITLLVADNWLQMEGVMWRSAWAGDVLALGAVGGTLIFAVDHIVTGLAAAMGSVEQRARGLESRADDLARELEELERHDALLARHTSWLHMASDVALGIDPGLEEQELLERAARLTSEQFGFFHVGIYILDRTGQWAELRAASSEGGKRMLARRHRLRVGQEGLIGHVTARGTPRIAADVDADALYYENPDLPETRSEITVPLRHHGRVIGALDIQEASPDAFQDGDVVAIQALADLIASALRNAQLVEQLQQSVADERRSYAQLSAQAWLERARATRAIGYRYDQGSVSQLTGDGAEIGEGSQGGRGAPGEGSWPLGVRGRIVGSVEAHKHVEQGAWSAEERELVQTVVEQLGAALESARLYEDAQFRASADRLVADVTGRIRETLDLDTVLRAVAEEIHDALELDEIVVHLIPPDSAAELWSER